MGSQEMRHGSCDKCARSTWLNENDICFQCEVKSGVARIPRVATFSEGDEVRYVPAPGDPDQVWWLGFDCAHCGDRSPSDEKYNSIYGWERDGEYRTLEYVELQCRILAIQILAKGTKNVITKKYAFMPRRLMNGQFIWLKHFFCAKIPGMNDTVLFETYEEAKLFILRLMSGMAGHITGQIDDFIETIEMKMDEDERV